ncbi:hypothetical protein PR048_027793 [Dryococelus australis]|uniref:Uncharacterized protein n=1 Tax=Dryococelus australis TaxID=614101 RepID=A0ABQ9GHG4_9NEOP|nr:hypothetical protein PR048_027793 [Dryococelus australis]
MALPPCSSDISPLDFFLWPRLKSLVYQPDNPPQSPEGIIARLHAAKGRTITLKGAFMAQASQHAEVVPHRLIIGGGDVSFIVLIMELLLSSARGLTADPVHDGRTHNEEIADHLAKRGKIERDNSPGKFPQTKPRQNTKGFRAVNFQKTDFCWTDERPRGLGNMGLRRRSRNKLRSGAGVNKLTRSSSRELALVCTASNYREDSFFGPARRQSVCRRHLKCLSLHASSTIVQPASRTLRSTIEILRDDKGETSNTVMHGPAVGGGRSPRKPADQRHRPARFPHSKIQERACPGIGPSSPRLEKNVCINERRRLVSWSGYIRSCATHAGTSDMAVFGSHTQLINSGTPIVHSSHIGRANPEAECRCDRSSPLVLIRFAIRHLTSFCEQKGKDGTGPCALCRGLGAKHQPSCLICPYLDLDRPSAKA